jgi:toxin YhaV
MQVNGWTLLFHDCIAGQLSRLHSAAFSAEKKDPAACETHANVRLFRALSHLLMQVIPADPSRDEYRQGNTLGATHRHWRRAKLGRRFRVFFRFDSRSRVIVYAWVLTLNPVPSGHDPVPPPPASWIMGLPLHSKAWVLPCF